MALADQNTELQGTWPLRELQRVQGAGEPEPDDAAVVTWSLRGRLKPVHAAAPEVWLDLQASAVVMRTCQRCLHPVALPVELARSIRFVADEQQAAALDAESDDDVLALTHSLDAMELVEDEILLDLPIVPRHEDCTLPLPSDPPASHPFAALAALRRGKSGLE